ncbi:hypothetical protein JY97_15270 [Alkalispirochaeta odontotermitis]|nr:hypothetical protein JY97_15270 [Alkalispirochaeta odontotermitis]
MESIVVSCSNQEIVKKIQDVIERNFKGRFSLRFPPTDRAILDILDFETPELLIVNFSDSELDSTKIRDSIMQDSWLHNFGIIGLYNIEVDREETIIAENRDINLLTLVDFGRIRSHLGKSLEILDNNRRMIFQGFLADKLVNRMVGKFEIDNGDYLLIPIYGGILANFLVRYGKLESKDRFTVQMALSELLLNAIEHGNCGISYQEKTEWLATGASIDMLIEKRCEDPVIAAKKVLLNWKIGDKSCKFTISDEGEGFDVLAYHRTMKQESHERLHGRGILMAQLGGNKLVYNTKGNQVTLKVGLKEKIENPAPIGFSDQELIKVKEGDTLMYAGEYGDCIYYISSGEYVVYYLDNPVGIITPADIFMGEMSFLLGNTRSATVVARTDGQVIKIPRKNFVNVIKEYPQYSVFLLKILAQKLVRSNESIATGMSVGHR